MPEIIFITRILHHEVEEKLHLLLAGYASDEDGRRQNVYLHGQSGAPNESLWSANPCLYPKQVSLKQATNECSFG